MKCGREDVEQMVNVNAFSVKEVEVLGKSIPQEYDVEPTIKDIADILEKSNIEHLPM